MVLCCQILGLLIILVYVLGSFLFDKLDLNEIGNMLGVVSYKNIWKGMVREFNEFKLKRNNYGV